MQKGRKREEKDAKKYNGKLMTKGTKNRVMVCIKREMERKKYDFVGNGGGGGNPTFFNF